MPHGSRSDCSRPSRWICPADQPVEAFSPTGWGRAWDRCCTSHGGFAGTTKVGQLDLNSDPEGAEVRHLLMRVGRQQISATRPAPDRFTYTVEYGAWRFTVPEQDLTPELRRLVQVVLNRGG